jgi:GDP-L-fucose synthase
LSLEQYDKIFVAGHRGLVGSALVRALERSGRIPLTQTRSELDLTDASAVKAWFHAERPQLVFLAAAKVGGIYANNTQRWDFLYQNLAIQNSVLSAALDVGTERLVFLGSSCIYPKLAPQPIKEEYLLTGALEPTNEPYAVAKIAGLKLVEAANQQFEKRWVSLMPTNLYGPGDNFNLQSSHVLPAMLRKFHEAQEAQRDGKSPSVVLWGSGTPRREFLHVDDLANAALYLAGLDNIGLFNVGCGEDISIADLADVIADIVGYTGTVVWDQSRPDGTQRKLLDSSRLRALGWSPSIPLRHGIEDTYQWFQSHYPMFIEQV